MYFAISSRCNEKLVSFNHGSRLVNPASFEWLELGEVLDFSFLTLEHLVHDLITERFSSVCNFPHLYRYSNSIVVSIFEIIDYNAGTSK